MSNIGNIFRGRVDIYISSIMPNGTTSPIERITDDNAFMCILDQIGSVMTYELEFQEIRARGINGRYVLIAEENENPLINDIPAIPKKDISDNITVRGNAKFNMINNRNSMELSATLNERNTTSGKSILQTMRGTLNRE